MAINLYIYIYIYSFLAWTPLHRISLIESHGITQIQPEFMNPGRRRRFWNIQFDSIRLDVAKQNQPKSLNSPGGVWLNHNVEFKAKSTLNGWTFPKYSIQCGWIMTTNSLTRRGRNWNPKSTFNEWEMDVNRSQISDPVRLDDGDEQSQMTFRRLMDESITFSNIGLNSMFSSGRGKLLPPPPSPPALHPLSNKKRNSNKKKREREARRSSSPSINKQVKVDRTKRHWKRKAEKKRGVFFLFWRRCFSFLGFRFVYFYLI